MITEKDPSQRAGYRNAQRMGFKLIDERMHAVCMLIDLPGSNGWIETYSRVFNLDVSRGYAQGEMAFYHRHRDDEVKPLPVRMSLLTRMWFSVYYEVAYRIWSFYRQVKWRLFLQMGRFRNRGVPAEASMQINTDCQLPCREG